jgi:hypothetical protein
VVDEHAREAVAERPVDDQRRHRGVDTAGQAADRAPLGADLRADQRHLLVDDRRGRPVALAPAHLEQEALEDVRAVRRVDDLRVELDSVEAASGRLQRRDGRGGR